MSASSIIISWDPPLSTLQNGVITRYKIIYWLQLANIGVNRTMIVVPGNITQICIFNLIPSSNYSMIITAATAVGFGPYHSLVMHLTSPPGIK